MARSCSRGAWIGRRAHGGSGSNSKEAQSVPISHKENVPLTHKRPPCPHTNRCIKKNRVCCPVSSPSFLKTRNDQPSGKGLLRNTLLHTSRGRNIQADSKARKTLREDARQRYQASRPVDRIRREGHHTAGHHTNNTRATRPPL